MENDEGASPASVAEVRRNLSEAIGQYMQVVHGASALLTDWALIAETVESSLDNETDQYAVWMGISPGLSTWRLIGLVSAMSQMVYTAAGKVL